ncbi:hypothetical protein [Nostoc sp. 'Peltigera membranacea cyanobiont' 210A]|uniref:hypothetical protein n=1 Tax=Nostoc sp. 'Peltigera membranacea cyanobiont' 210A TaxID=2014529 RepID=UPI001CB999DB|nr:hypothetical protein [Nostoc sp. 'Peltigera membranacea cyanobiont' 210A]
MAHGCSESERAVGEIALAQPVVDIASQNLGKWIKYDNTAPQQMGYGDRHIVEEFLKCNFLQHRVDVVRQKHLRGKRLFVADAKQGNLGKV